MDDLKPCPLVKSSAIGPSGPGGPLPAAGQVLPSLTSLFQFDIRGCLPSEVYFYTLVTEQGTLAPKNVITSSPAFFPGHWPPSVRETVGSPMNLMKILEKLRSISPSLVYRLLQLTSNTIKTDKRFMEVWWQLVKDDRMILTIREAYNIYFYLSGALPLGGAIAELGVYKGGSAKLMGEFKAGLPFHLFDTFEGMPSVNRVVDLHHEGDFSDITLENVQSYLESCSQCVFHPGFFPDTTRDLSESTEFCFVHLDVDIYESTLSGLEFFYPRLKKGGVIISHDFNSISCPGVKKAFDEYFKDKNEQVIHLWDTQGMVRKQN